jgi:hypothetical protein
MRCCVCGFRDKTPPTAQRHVRRRAQGSLGTDEEVLGGAQEAGEGEGVIVGFRF